MSLYDFSSHSLWLNLAIFAGGAVAIWIAGTKLEHYLDAIAVRTELGKAFLGILLLSAATSLPEVATTVTATLSGNTSMAVHNLLGGIVMQTAVLAVADIAMGKRALTFVSPHFSHLMQAAGLILLLSVILVGIPATTHVNDHASPYITLAVVAWSLALLAAYLLMIYQTYYGQSHPRWYPADADKTEADSISDGQEDELVKKSLPSLAMYFSIGATVVLIAGWAVASTGEAIAKQTRLGTSFVGFTLVAIATSLPEVSTTIAAARSGRIETAFANIFGSNAFDATLLVLVAALAGATALVESLTASTQFAVALGVFLTCLYLWGLLERQDKTIGRIGWDSAAVFLFALLGNVAVFWLR